MNIYNQNIKFDNNACRCFEQAPNGAKLWVSPFNITKDYVYNFLNEHDRHMLDVYRKTKYMLNFK